MVSLQDEVVVGMKAENIRLIIDVLIIPLISAAVFVLWDLNKSVSALNVQVGVLISNNQSLEKRVDKIEETIFKRK